MIHNRQFSSGMLHTMSLRWTPHDLASSDEHSASSKARPLQCHLGFNSLLKFQVIFLWDLYEPGGANDRSVISLESQLEILKDLLGRNHPHNDQKMHTNGPPVLLESTADKAKWAWRAASNDMAGLKHERPASMFQHYFWPDKSPQ